MCINAIGIGWGGCGRVGCMTIFRDKQTGQLFKTNYIDYYGGVVFSLRGLIAFDKVEEVKVTKNQYETTTLADYRQPPIACVF